MQYTTLTIGDKEYKLRATAATIVELEKRIGGKNPLDILMAVERGELPSVTNILYILHASLQKFHHGIDVRKVLDMYDAYIESGQNYIDLIPVLVEVFRVSGFFPAAPKEKQEDQETQEL